MNRGTSQLARKPFRSAPKPMRAVGQSTRAKLERRLRPQLVASLAEIHWCEKCGVVGPTDIAHRVKRRFIWALPTEAEQIAEYMTAAKLCRKCHQGYDEATGPDPHQRMYDGITALIQRRR